MSLLFSHRCDLSTRTLWLGRALLYEDRVRIQGWTWDGRYRRTIPLERVREVEWRPVPEGVNLILHLDEGRSVPLSFPQGAGLWNAKLHDLLDRGLLNHPTLPDIGGEQNIGSEQAAIPASARALA